MPLEVVLWTYFNFYHNIFMFTWRTMLYRPYWIPFKLELSLSYKLKSGKSAQKRFSKYLSWELRKAMAERAHMRICLFPSVYFGIKKRWISILRLPLHTLIIWPFGTIIYTHYTVLGCSSSYICLFTIEPWCRPTLSLCSLHLQTSNLPFCNLWQLSWLITGDQSCFSG